QLHSAAPPKACLPSDGPSLWRPARRSHPQVDRLLCGGLTVRADRPYRRRRTGESVLTKGGAAMWRHRSLSYALALAATVLVGTAGASAPQAIAEEKHGQAQPVVNVGYLYDQLFFM